jgi:hypothetical protein
MCTHTSLAYFLDEMGKETLWQNGAFLTGLNFKYSSGVVLLVAKRTNKRGVPEVTFIERPNARDCLRALWSETVRKNSGLVWQADKFGT